MNNSYNSRLCLMPTEKKTLRSNGILLKDIAGCSVKHLQQLLHTSKVRAMEIKALYEFQLLPSIGNRFAHDLVSMGYYSLSQLKHKNPAKLYNELERMTGAWADPCVEDQFRLVVHYANHPDSAKNWWDFTAERKAYRGQHGYPSSRPAKPWYELEEYQKVNKVNAKSAATKKEVVQRLKEAMSYIRKNYTEKISLKQLSKIALLSPYHFQRSFKSVYELSPLEFITHLRLKKACQLLRKTRKPVADIAIQCGFENTSSFIRLFRERFKQTPLLFRQKHQEMQQTKELTSFSQ